MIATTARLASLLLAASAPALAVSNSSIVYVGSNYTGPNVAHPNATWNGHSVCYNYFLQKDNCVHGSLDHPCKEDGDHDVEPTYTTSGETIMKMTAFSVRGVFDFTETIVSTSIDMPSLARRYDSTQKVEYVAGGNGTCGFYDTATQLGACVWSGPLLDGSDPANAGWVDTAFNSTCGKKLYVQRQGQPQTVQYVPVLDGCNFLAKKPEDGCFQIYLTEAAFKLFATPEELQAGHLQGNISWDFDNLGLTKPENAPL